jgi:hypothetical protein
MYRLCMMYGALPSQVRKERLADVMAHMHCAQVVAEVAEAERKSAKLRSEHHR